MQAVWKNPHNMFVLLNGAMQISCRSNKSKAKELAICLAKKWAEINKNNKRKTSSLGIHSDDLQNHENQVQTTQQKNVGLQGGIQAKNERIKYCQKTMNKLRESFFMTKKKFLGNLVIIFI